MTRIVTATKLDYLTGRFYLALYPILFLVGLLIGVVAKMPIFTIILVIVLAVFIAGGVFSVNERNHGEKLYATLPLRRRDMVTGRYAYALTLGIAATLIASLLGFAASWIAGVDMGQLGPARGSLATTPAMATMIFWFAVGFAFLYFCFSIAVAFPIYFRFGFSRSYIFTMLPLYLVVLVALLVTRNLNPQLGLSDTIQFFMDHTYLLPIIGVVGGLILLAISWVVATRVYQGKEL